MSLFAMCHLKKLAKPKGINVHRAQKLNYYVRDKEKLLASARMGRKERK